MATRLGNSLPIQCQEHKHVISLLTVLLFYCNSMTPLICKINTVAMRYLASLEIESFIMVFCESFSNQFSEQIIYKTLCFRAVMLPIALSMD